MKKRIFFTTFIVMLVGLGVCSYSAQADTTTVTGQEFLTACKESLLSFYQTDKNVPTNQTAIMALTVAQSCKSFFTGLSWGIEMAEVFQGGKACNLSEGRKVSNMVADYVDFAMSEQEKVRLNENYQLTVTDFFVSRCGSGFVHSKVKK